MGMFDDYEPVPPIACPVDGRILEDWQGKDGPNMLNHYRQGEPIEDPDDDFPLHGRFEIHAGCLELDPDGRIYTGDGKRYRLAHSVDAYGVRSGGIWAETHLVRVSGGWPKLEVLWRAEP